MFLYRLSRPQGASLKTTLRVIQRPYRCSGERFKESVNFPKMRSLFSPSSPENWISPYVTDLTASQKLLRV